MPSKRVRKNKTIWIGAVTRKDFRKESTFRTKTESLKWEDDLRELLKSHIPIQDIKRLLDVGTSPKAVPTVWEQEKTPIVSLLELANGYLNHAKLAVCNDQYQEKRRVLKRFLKWHGNPSHSVESLRVGQVHDYLHEQARARSNHAANKDRTHLGAAWNWGIKYEKCPSPNPFLKVEKLHHDLKHHYMPPKEDFLKVVNIAEEQDAVLLWTYYYTAGRRQEVLDLKWDDIDFAKKRLRLYTRKRRGGNLEADWVDMLDPLVELLQEHKKSATTEYVFVKLSRGKGYLEPFRTGRRKWPKALCAKAGVKPFGCHGIRALTATTLANDDAPMVAIKQHLRHKNLSVTEAYIRGMVSIKPHLTVLEGGRSKASAAVVNG